MTMKILAIDGNSILNRAYYGIRQLTNKNGVYTNAVYGFLNIYFKNLSEVDPDGVAVAFDMRTPTFRHKASPAYKANRKGMPEELAMQLPLIKNILTFMGIKVIECEGYEADDILGTISKKCHDGGHECFVLTGDRDSLQLINEKVTVRLATTKETKVYTPGFFEEEYGFEPIYLIDLKALMGDSSDNISGVPGIGQKTATTLISKWKTVENLYENLDAAELTKSVRAKLENGRDAAKESKWLATICLEAPIEESPEKLAFGDMQTEDLRSILTELELFNILKRFDLEPADEKTNENQKQIDASDAPLDNEILDRLIKKDKLYYTFEDGVLKIAGERKNETYAIYTTEDKELILKLFSSDVAKCTFKSKTHYRFAYANNTYLKNLAFDGEIAAYLLDPSASDYTVEKLCFRYNLPYCRNETCGDTASLEGLCSFLEKEIEAQKMHELMYEIEQPLIEVLASMEHEGVGVDSEGVRRFGEELKKETDGIQRKIYEMCGKEFNLSSPKQLGDILFELGLPLKKKTKKGFSTNAEVLEELRDKHPVIDLVLRHRQLTKLSSTYVDSLLKTVGTDGRIHSCFKQTETRTGRISSTEPNMQNIPVRTELGREMRKFFTAQNGRILLDADYSQIELRILAHICEDETMIEGFNNGADIHASTAAQVFGLPEEMVTPEMRSAAKAVNFGIIYGIGAFSLSKDINVSVFEAKKYIENYLHNFPRVEKFMNDAVEGAVKNGYVTTMFGRKRYIPELSASNKNMQAAGKRIAMNTPVQGSAADIIKIAMVRVYRRLKEETPNAKLILQVHDELIVECEKQDAEKAAKIISEEMTGACKLKAPLIVDVNRGETWYEAKG